MDIEGEGEETVNGFEKLGVLGWEEGASWKSLMYDWEQSLSAMFIDADKRFSE